MMRCCGGKNKEKSRQQQQERKEKEAKAKNSNDKSGYIYVHIRKCEIYKGNHSQSTALLSHGTGNESK